MTNITITNFDELCAPYGIEGNLDELAKALYKGTECGMWIEQTDNGVKIGSIVEGCDEGTTTYDLDYPFEFSDFSKTIEQIEDEAQFMWEAANLDEVRILMRWEETEPLAVFIDLPGTNNVDTCQVYQHTGQHGSADLGHVLRKLDPATEDQYQDLLEELRNIGYDPIVVRPTRENLTQAYENRLAAINDIS